ncbi:ATP-binding protein, partial [Thalassospira sp.]
GKVLVLAQALDINEDVVSFRISVRDEGIGIAQNKLEAIFDAFTQADTTTTRRYGGTGLGLTICQRMVQAMGGRVQVESQEGKGSRFWFDLTLPRSSETEVAQQEGQTASPDDARSEKAEAADPG